MDYVVPSVKSPSLSDLNNKVVEKLYELVDSLNAKSEPDMVRACVESLAKFNASVKGSDIFPKHESDEERQQREAASILEAEIGD